MRIELNTGGLSSGAVISGFQTDFSSLQSKSQSMISALQAVKSFVHSMNGGVGTLQGAVDQISSRQSSEDAKSSKLNEVASKANGFVELARRIDLEVGGMVNQNKNEFYDVNPWSRPPEPEREKKWYEKGWDWVCDKGKKLGEGIKKAVTWTVDSLGKIKDCIVDFCKEHWKEILIGIAAITIGALLTALTGGGAAAFLPALLAGLKTAAIAGVVSGGINAAISTTAAAVRGEEINAGTIFKSFGDGFASGFMVGGIMAGASMTISSGFRIAAKAGATTGRAGGIGQTNGFKILSPDKIATDGNSGGTLFKIGKTFRLDVDTRILQGGKYVNTLKLPNYLHMHIPNLTGNIPSALIVGGHIPVGMYGSTLIGVLRAQFKK